MSDAHLALVTGASRGIGFALANISAGHGYDLVVAADDDNIHDVPQRALDGPSGEVGVAGHG